MRKILLSVLLLSSCGGVASVTTSTTSTTTTLPVERFTVVAVGDIACSTKQRTSELYDCKDGDVAQLAKAQNPSYVFALGDIQYQSHDYDEFIYNFFPYWKDLMGIIKPIAGNHEYSDGKATDYYRAWPEYPSPGYYSFDIGSKWHVVALNTNDECQFVGCGKNSEQYRWLQLDLTKNSDKCIVAIGHHPRYSSGARGETVVVDDLYSLMANSGVVVYISGHDHHYERLMAPVQQYVVGTGGKDLRSVGSLYKSDSVTSEFATSKHHGVLVMDFIDNSLTTSFITIDNKKFDEHQIQCTH